MFRHTSYRLTAIYQAILATTLGVGTLAHAITLDQADIKSTQHEPLSAVITVTNIDAKNFSANLAPSNIYRQMGMTPNDDIRIRFTPTSESAGRIELSSSTPISTPFTDIVLSLDNNGEHRVEPQTLLMPMSSPSRIADDLVTPIMVGSGEEQNLPIVSESVVLYGEPLQVQVVEPPEIFVEETIAHQDTQITAQDDTAAQSSQLSSDVAQPIVLNKEQQVIASITPEGTDTQFDILTETITQKIYPAGTAPQSPPAVAMHEEPLITQEITQEEEPSPADDTTQASTDASLDTQSTDNAVYIVQSGDSLWSIANAIANANNMAVADVMDALFTQNPNAFNNNNASQLKANASLSIPNYEVIPSQKAISEAIASQGRRQSSNVQTKNNARTPNKAQTPTTAKSLPKPQVTLVTPSQSGQTTGSQHRTTSTDSYGGDLVTSLKSTRSKTASNARRVNSLNQELSSATQKLQLQNQKLAELEARLKALKEKK